MATNNPVQAAAAASRYEALLASDPDVLDAIPAAVYVCAADGTIVRFNKRAVTLWGRTPRPGDSDERFCGSYRLYDLEGRPLARSRTPMAAALDTGRPQHDKEVVIERPDGSRIVAAVYIDPLKDPQGRVQGAINCFHDITAHNRGGRSLAQRIEEQTALYQLTDSLHRARSLDDVFESALNAITRALRCPRASILLFDDAGIMRFVAWRGLSDAYRTATDGHSPWARDCKDPQPICLDDMAQADLDAPLKATIEKEGIGALAFIPLVTNDELVGKFMAYYDAPHEFTEGEMDVAVTIGRQLGFSVQRMRAEEARRVAEQELRQSELRERARANELETIMKAVPAVVWVARDPDCRKIVGNPAAYELLRLPHDANLSLSGPEGDRPSHFQVFVDGRALSTEELPVQRAARGEEVRNFENETRFDDGTSRYLFGNATPLRDASGRAIGAVAAFTDITDRKKAEQQRDLLIAELNHRVKNTLATVISIAGQSFSKSQDPESAWRSFESRIRALARTHGCLAGADWAGVSFEDILSDEFAPYSSEDGNNLRRSGPGVVFKPKCALTLGMAIHELTTNAAKYGSLSVKQGTVDVAWDVAGDHLHISWTEAGGPPVLPPERSGFGRLLLERALTSDLRGDVRLDFAKEGLRCTIRIPLEDHVARIL